MTNTKICPACQKELPILAMRCKYCGFKQPRDSEDGGVGVGKHMTRPLKAIKKPTSTTSSPPVRNTKAPRPATERRPKRETMMGVASPATSTAEPKNGATALSSSAKTGASSSHSLGSKESAAPARKKTMMGASGTAKSGSVTSATAQTIQKAREQRQAEAEKKAKEASVLPPPKPSSTAVRSQVGYRSKSSQLKTIQAKRDIKKPKTSMAPASAGRIGGRRRGRNRGLDDTTGDSWIPELEESSQLIVLESEGLDNTRPNTENITREVSVGDISLITSTDVTDQENVPVGSGVAKRAMRKRLVAVGEEMKAAWMRVNWTRVRESLRQIPQYAERALAFIQTKIDNWREQPAGVRKVHLLVAGLGIMMVVGIILLVAFAGGEPGSSKSKEVTLPAEETAASTKTQTATKKETKKKSQITVVKKESDAPSASLAKEGAVKQELPPVVRSSRPCQPMAKYASFSLDAPLKTAMAHVRGESVCDLMGRDAATISAAFDSTQIVYNGGYDGLANGTALEVRPESGSDTVVRFLFYRDALFRIMFEFGLDKKRTVDMTKFGKLWNGKAKEYRLKEQIIVAIDDGQVRLELVTDRIGPPNRRAVISDLKVKRDLALKLDSHWRATQRTAMGMVLLKKKEFRQAAKKFKSAMKASRSLGVAYLGYAEAQLGRDDKRGARKALKSGMGATTDKRVAQQLSDRLKALH